MNKLLFIFFALFTYADYPDSGFYNMENRQDHLYVIHATKGKYAGNQLTLTDVSPSVSYFTNDLKRNAGKMSVSKFLNKWKPSNQNRYKANTSNANLLFHVTRDTPYHNLSVNLTNPAYNMRGATLTFSLAFMNKSDVLPDGTEMYEVTLYIDANLPQ